MTLIRTAIAASLCSLNAYANTCVPLQAGATDQTVYVEFIDESTGIPNSSLAFNSTGIDLEYVRSGDAAVDITEATQTANGAHSDGGFVSVGHGRYRLDLPDAAVASGVPQVVVQGVITGYIMLPCVVALSPPVDVVEWGGTSISTPPAVNATQISGDSAVADAVEAAWDGTAGSAWPLGIVDKGTAAGATATTIDLRSAVTFADDELIGSIVCVTSASAGAGQCRLITDYANTNDRATVDTWTTTPTGTITYQVIANANGASGALTAADVWSYVGGRTLTALDEDNTTIDLNATQVALAAGSINEAAFATTAGTFYPLGIIDQGTAQAATSTTLQLRAAASFANDEIIGATCIITGGSTGVGQSRTVTDYVSSSDTATVDAWTTTPTGTIEYKCYGTAPSQSGSSLTQADIRTAVGLASANLDTQLATIDSNVDAILVDTGTTLQAEVDGIQADVEDLQARTPAALVGGRMDASVGAMAADVMTAAAAAASLTTELQSGLSTLDAAGVRTAVGLASANLDTQLDALPTAVENATEALARQRILTGTCDSGSTTTCVDDALTQAAEAQLDDRLICFDDSWCALITGFTPGTDTVTTTKTAPSTRSGKAYTIFPATAQ